jgi:hypothetical protein
MWRETEFRIENAAHRPFADLDITPTASSWIGLSAFPEEDGGQQSVYFGSGEQIKLPENIRFSLVRSIDDQTVLVGYHRSRDEENKNAWVIKSSGEIKANFFMGDAIEDVIVTKDFIVVTYFDEAACYGDGIEIYSFEGERLFSYEELFGKEAVEIFDCYAAALVEDNQIIFCPYTEFPVVLFDIAAGTQKVWETPANAHGFSAITKLDDKIYFHHSYTEKFAIFEWQIGSEKAERIGEYPNYFVRGLSGGRFLAKGDSGYTIISLQ